MAENLPNWVLVINFSFAAAPIEEKLLASFT
jgi:hypothetical protein